MRSVNGDVDSFNQLIRRWERPIYALAYRTIGREDDARDVCQETFLRAFRALKGFKGQAKFSSWLYRIALNLCRDWMRRQRRTPVVQMPEDVDIAELAAAQGPVESIETLVARRELGRAVAQAMATLPEEQRTAIVLKEYHGLTFQEIADLQGCPLSTVKTRLYQGLSVAAAAVGRGRYVGGRHPREHMTNTRFTCGDSETPRRLSLRRARRPRPPRRSPGTSSGARRAPARSRRSAACGACSASGPRRPRRCASPPCPSRCAVTQPPASRWQGVPAWAQVVAATLALAVGAAVANVQVRRDAAGWTLTTGWMAPAGAGRAGRRCPGRRPTPGGRPSPRSKQSLRRDFAAERASHTPAAAAAEPDPQSVARVRSLIQESERRQQQELALRLAQLGRDLDLQRRADLVRIDQGIGQLEGRTGAAVARQREMLDYIVRAGLRPPQ